MDTIGAILCDNLIKWFQTLDLKAKHGNPSELSDGVAMAEALTQIAPEYFTPTWNMKIKTDVGHNWRLKVSNLKKILEGVVDYHQDILNLSLQEFSRPDVVNIAETADPADLGRLLQLVLSCAVNCVKKEEYITRIMEMELSCQRSLMQAIQELQTLTLGTNRGSVHLDKPAPDKTDADMKEALAQKCHVLDTQVKILQEEKMTLLSEVARLTAAQSEVTTDYNETWSPEIDESGASLGPAHAGTLRYTNMRAQLDALKEELDKVELQRDDQGARADAAERELTLYKLRNEELQMAASENLALKDELDALRETAAKATALEATVASYKKRMEEHVDLRRQVKLLERANTEHVQRAIEYDQAAVKANAVKAQLDIYKKQVTDLNEKLDTERTKADRLEIENKMLSSRAASLQRERDAVLHERDTLRDTVDELRCSTITAGANEGNVSREMSESPHDMKEKLIRLTHENKLLRENQATQLDQTSVQALLEDYVERLEKQRTMNREANQRIMQLEATLEANPRLATAMEDNQRKSLQVEELQATLAEERRRASKLQEALTARDHDLLAIEDKYKKCLEKAKEVIKSLDPRASGFKSNTMQQYNTTMPPSSPDIFKLNIKPVVKKEEERDDSPMKEEPLSREQSRSPELAQISALVTRPPKIKHSKHNHIFDGEGQSSSPPSGSSPPKKNTPSSSSKYKRILIKQVAKKGPVDLDDDVVPISEEPRYRSAFSPPEKPTGPLPTPYYVDEHGNKIWVCPACRRPDNGSPMIGCDGCDGWYHWVCVGITEEPSATEDWFCKSCLAKRAAMALAGVTSAQQSLSDITLGYSRAALPAAGASRPDAAPAANNRLEWSGGEVPLPGANEQRLLATAWYQLGVRCHRDAVDARFALLSSGQSFLARQRRQAPRARPSPAHAPVAQ